MNCRNKLFYPLLNRTTFLFFIIFTLLLNIHNSHSITLNKVIATIGNEVITLAEYQQFVKMSGNIVQSDVVDEVLLRRMIEERVILNEAKKKGIEISEKEVDEQIEAFCEENGLLEENLEEFLKEEGITLNIFREIIRNRIIAMRFVYNEVDSKVVINDKEIRDFYNENKRNYLARPETAEIKAIFLRLKEDASVTEITDLKLRSLKIVNLLRSGEDFEKIAEEYSDEPLRSIGGMLGSFSKNSLIAPLDKKVFSMKKGEISEPIWVKEGVYIITLVEINSDLYKSLDDVKDEIKSEIYKLKREKYFNEWIKALWEKASITISLI